MFVAKMQILPLEVANRKSPLEIGAIANIVNSIEAKLHQASQYSWRKSFKSSSPFLTKPSAKMTRKNRHPMFKLKVMLVTIVRLPLACRLIITDTK